MAAARTRTLCRASTRCARWERSPLRCPTSVTHDTRKLEISLDETGQTGSFELQGQLPDLAARDLVADALDGHECIEQLERGRTSTVPGSEKKSYTLSGTIACPGAAKEQTQGRLVRRRPLTMNWLDGIRESWDKLSDRERRMLSIMGGVALAMLAFVVVWTTTSALAEVEEERDAIRGVLSDIDRAGAVLAKRQAERQAIEQRFLVKAPALAAYVEAKAKEEGLEVRQVVEDPEKVSGGYRRQAVRVSFAGVSLRPIMPPLGEHRRRAFSHRRRTHRDRALFAGRQLQGRPGCGLVRGRGQEERNPKPSSTKPAAKRTMNRAKWLTLAGYNGFFWLWFWLFCYWTFPYDRVASFLSDKVAESGAGYNLEIGELSPHWLTGVTLDDVVVRKQKTEPNLPRASARPAPRASLRMMASLKIKEAHARFGLFSLLFGGKSLTFDADLEQGAVEEPTTKTANRSTSTPRSPRSTSASWACWSPWFRCQPRARCRGLRPDPRQGADQEQRYREDRDQRPDLGRWGREAQDGLDGRPDHRSGQRGRRHHGARRQGGRRKGEEAERQRYRHRSRRQWRGALRGPGQSLTARYRAADPLHGRLQEQEFGRTKAMFSLLDTNNSSQIRAAKTPDGGLAYRLSGAMASVRAIPAGRAAGRKAALRPQPCPPSCPRSAADDDE